jgi:hypothetical protein
MGYMGLGMQKWIYSREPRTKLYVRNRISSFTPLPKYSRTFLLKPSAKENKLLLGSFTVGIVLCLTAMSGWFVKKFTDYSNENTKNIILHYKRENEKAFHWSHSLVETMHFQCKTFSCYPLLYL